LKLNSATGDTNETESWSIIDEGILIKCNEFHEIESVLFHFMHMLSIINKKIKLNALTKLGNGSALVV
jgi:hypothetical protein